MIQLTRTPKHSNTRPSALSNKLRGIALLALIASCGKSEERSAYERIAKEANPALTALEPMARTILSTGREDVEGRTKVIQACEDAEPYLLRVPYVFQDPHLQLEPDELPVSTHVDHILFERAVICREDDETTRPRCADWCFERWRALADEVERVRDRARAQGVEVVSLLR